MPPSMKLPCLLLILPQLGLAIDDDCGASHPNVPPDDSNQGCEARKGNAKMPLHLVDESRAAASGGVCLDGSRPGYYYQPATRSDNAQWLLYFKGGGWCYDEDSCAARAKGELGSSDHFPATFAFSGLMDSDPQVNPTFAHFHRVILWYCDGASFAGDRDAPVKHAPTNQTIYFRGRRVLRLLLQTIAERHGLANASEVLLSGGSAGGLATFLHADQVKAQLEELGANLRVYKAAPVSGLFALHDDATGTPLYPNEMRHVFTMQNCSSGVNSACVASLPPHEAWRCIFANYSYAHTSVPMFPLQSVLDSWQMGNIWKGDSACARSKFTKCTAEEVRELNGYAHDLLADLKRTSKFRRDGEGGFVESCYEHVQGQGGGFGKYTINGTSEQEALTRWWHAPPSAPAVWYLPCSLRADPPHQCNPTCG